VHFVGSYYIGISWPCWL